MPSVCAYNDIKAFSTWDNNTMQGALEIEN